jgi:hypothetical protein
MIGVCSTRGEVRNVYDIVVVTVCMRDAEKLMFTEYFAPKNDAVV